MEKLVDEIDHANMNFSLLFDEIICVSICECLSNLIIHDHI